MSHTLSSIKAEFLSALQYNFTQREKLQLFHELMSDVWGISKVAIITNPDVIFAHVEELLAIVARLNSGEPVQYISGVAYFRELKLKVNAHVLIPRPETEELVGLALDVLEQKNTVLDLGTGSGCIALSLKKERADLNVSALDSSDGALEVAKSNATEHQIAVNFLLRSMDEPLADLGKFDVLVSNPPYIGLDEHDLLDKNVVAFEPKMALFSINSDPLYFYRELYLRSLELLTPEGYMLLELHEDYAEETAQLFPESHYSSVEILKDFQGKNRFLKAQKR